MKNGGKNKSVAFIILSSINSIYIQYIYIRSYLTEIFTYSYSVTTYLHYVMFLL